MNVSSVCNSLLHEVKMQYVHTLHFLIFWVREHFAHTAFLHSQTIMLYFHVFLDKQRVLMFTIYNPYQNIFQMTLNFHCAVDDIVLLMHFAHTAFLLCQTLCFSLKIHFLKIFFKNPFYHLIEHRLYFKVSFHAKKKWKWPKCHILHFYFTEQLKHIVLH